MQIDKNTETREVTIQGNQFNVPAPFAEGHPCTANEAAALNQLLAENVRNNFSKRVKETVEAGGDIASLQKELDNYVAEYEFGVRRSAGGGRAPVDPVEKEALNLATERVKDSLREKGYKVSDIGNAKIKELAADAVEKYPHFRDQAKKIVKERSKIGSDALELDLS